MSRVVALIDGEHYPPVVRAALDALRGEHEVVAAVFLGGTEKVEGDADAAYGVPLLCRADPAAGIVEAVTEHGAEAVYDLSDEPVVSSADRFRLAGAALSAGAAYVGADFRFEPPRAHAITRTPTLAIVGTGKRVGKTAISAYVARCLKAAGLDIAVLAMGRGGPAEPEVIHGETVRLTTADLLALAAKGAHAASDNYEDAVMSRVTTVGCRRCGGGMAGETFFSNVAEGAAVADCLGKELILLEGSGAAVPPVHADATVLVIGAGRGETYVRDYFGPYRLAAADLVVLAGAEEPEASAAAVEALRSAVDELAPGVPCVAVTFRPGPIEPVAGKRAFFVTTARPLLAGRLAEHLQSDHGVHVVGVSSNLSDRARLREELRAASGSFDVLLTELKAAAIDVVAAAGEEAGVPTVLCDNVPLVTDGQDLRALAEDMARTAIERGRARGAGR